MKNEHIVIVALILILGASYFGYINLKNGSITTNPYQSNGTPYQTPTQTQTPITGTEPDAQLYFEVTNAISYADVATTTETDVCKAQAGTFNFLQLFDTKAQSANPQAMNSMVSDGSALVIHVASTADPSNGKGYYDGWYYCITHVGNPIYQMSLDDFNVAQTSPSYTYTINPTGDPIIGYVSWTSGTTPYWNLGKLYIFPRIATDATESIGYQGSTLGKVTDDLTFENNTEVATANATLASTSENLVFSMYGAYANLGYGFPLLVVSSNGQILQYSTYLVMTTSMLSLGQPSGWSPLSDSTLYAMKGYYVQLGPYFAPKGQKMSFSVNIPINAQNAPASTKYLFQFWLVDCQNPNSISGGSMVLTLPTAYGFIYQYGPQKVEQGSTATNGVYATSSGSSTYSQLSICLQTAP
jgi:hypothetical protein